MARKRKPPSRFSEILSGLMEEKKIGVRTLAQAAKVPHTSLVGWKSGQHIPTDYDAIGRLADALGVSLSFLLRGKDDKAKRAPTITECFQHGDVLFEGLASILCEKGSLDPDECFAHVTIRRLIPRSAPTPKPPLERELPTVSMVMDDQAVPQHATQKRRL